MSTPVRSAGWQVTGTAGVVAAGGAASAAAGIRILEDGGNAADAAVATILALSVVDFGRFAFGGEVPFMIYDAHSRAVRVLSGQGRAPLSAEAITWYLEHGIPTGGDMKGAAVPGAPDLCLTALQLFGTMSFGQVVQPTLDLLAEGTVDWHPLLARTLRRMVGAERACAGNRIDKLRAASARFYRGDIASELEAWYREKGGFLTRTDLEAHGTRLEDAVGVTYRGYSVYKCGPWTQGPYLLQALRLLEGYNLRALGHNSANYIHLVTEAIKLAMADRDRYYGDPLFADVPLEALLSDRYTILRRTLIDEQTACNEARPGDPLGMRALVEGGEFRPTPGGTTTCVVADRWGNVVSATPSCNDTGGPKGICPITGVAHGSRLTSLNTTPGHPNCIKAGKRPRITLTPTMVLKNGRPVFAISVAGGDLQDQTTLSVLLNAIEFGMAPGQAVTAPRFATECHEDSFNPAPDRRSTLKSCRLMADPSLVGHLGTRLSERGHTVAAANPPIADPVMITIDHDNGVMRAAGDPAAGRHAASLDM